MDTDTCNNKPILYTCINLFFVRKGTQNLYLNKTFTELYKLTH